MACISRSSRAALHFFSSTFLDCLLCLHLHGMLQEARALAARPASMQNSFASGNDELIVAFRSRLRLKRMIAQLGEKFNCAPLVCLFFYCSSLERHRVKRGLMKANAG